MMEWEKQKFSSDIYNDVFDCVCAMSERYCEQEDIVPPTPEDVDAFDQYNDYLNDVTVNAITNIIDTYENAGMSYEKLVKTFDDIAIDEFIDLDSAQF